MSVGLRYGQLEEVLFRYLGFQADERERLQTRIRMLKKSRLPTERSLSPGPTAKYSMDDIFQLAFAMELVEEGVSVQAAAMTVRRFWGAQLASAPARAWQMREAGSAQALLVVVYRTTFDGWTLSPTRHAWEWLPADLDKAREWDEGLLVRVVTTEEFMTSGFFESEPDAPLSYGRHRAYVINCSKVTLALRELLVRGEFAPADWVDSWLQERLATEAGTPTCG